MQIIDTHIHFSNIHSFADTASQISQVDYNLEGLRKGQAEQGIAAAIAMGLTETEPGSFPDDQAATPMILDLDRRLPDNLYCCPGINPYDLSRRPAALAELALVLEQARTVGIKLYAGYYPFPISDPVFDPVYRLAAEKELPVVVHGGVTYSPKGLLRYAHPLSFEETIAAHPELTFVIAHMGEPWGMDTAALMSKHPHVHADLSGLLVTDAATIRRKSAQLEERIRLRQPLLFEERPDRWLFGSDWPLAPLGAYLAFIKELVPEDWHQMVFRTNALRVFSRLNRFMPQR